MLDERRHAACVDGWLKRSDRDLAPDAVLRLFDAALSALWTRTRTTLGEITLTAVAERVLFNAAEKFPLFTALKVDPVNGITCRGLSESRSPAQRPELIKAVRFVLMEFLTVVGHLTAEILTPELHAGLSAVSCPAPSGARKDLRS